jgi:hypothetical protein
MNKRQELTTSLLHLQALKEHLHGVPNVHQMLHQVPCLINKKKAGIRNLAWQHI